MSFFNPKSYKELKNFTKGKNIIAVNNIGRSFPELKINIILRILDIKQVIISNFGNIQGPGSFHSINGRFKDLFFKKLPQKITILLSIFGVCSKIDIRFVSRKDKLDWGTKNFLSKGGEIKKIDYQEEHKEKVGLIITGNSEDDDEDYSVNYPGFSFKIESIIP